jgi:hypothetical protein
MTPLSFGMLDTDEASANNTSTLIHSFIAGPVSKAFSLNSSMYEDSSSWVYQRKMTELLNEEHLLNLSLICQQVYELRKQKSRVYQAVLYTI